jgi:hypothetical protein
MQKSTMDSGERSNCMPDDDSMTVIRVRASQKTHSSASRERLRLFAVQKLDVDNVPVFVVRV